jgi:mannose/cellobiose epimerase-like protein (N-acyl-D-glucosamine 2-epimerase family)
MMTTLIKKPDFKNPGFIHSHIKTLTEFYAQHAIDTEHGGYYQTLKANGEHTQASIKQLVSSTRLTYVFASVGKLLGREDLLKHAKHGYDYVCSKHHDVTRNAYNWVMDGDKGIDQDNYCYGLDFVLLMYSASEKAGLEGAREGIEDTFQLMENRFWQPEFGLYVDQINADWSIIDSYRGQNANMHSCEAMIAAFEATQDKKYLQRALLIAENICLHLTKDTDGLIWEHYQQNWSIDWDYNKDDPRNLYKPWGYQPGHLTEWTKLLLMINRHQQVDWLVPQAEKLFNAGMKHAWDDKHGGLLYGFAPDGTICDDEKYFWVHAEALAAAALLAKATNNQRYWDDYQRLWQYSWPAFCENEHKPWWRLLSREGKVLDKNIASPGAKIDYHTIGACLEILNVLSE